MSAPGIGAPGTVVDNFFDAISRMLSNLPSSPIAGALDGALLLVRRTVFNNAPTAIPVQLGQNATGVTGTIGATDPEGDPIVHTLLTQPSSGTVTLDRATGAYTYTPAVLNTYGSTDQFTVRVSDRGFHLHLLRPRASYATVAINVAPDAAVITFPEIDSGTSPLAVRVDKSQAAADGIKLDARGTVTLTLPGPATSYTWLANKPELADVAATGNQLILTAKTAGFLGLSVKSADGSAARYLGVYIADPSTHVVPDMVANYVPVGTVARPDQTGDQFLESSNFRAGVAPIDYLYIYDQGGPDKTDGNVKGMLTQAVRHGLVPVAVFYNIQSTDSESPAAAFQAINDPGFMKRYFTKLAADFTLMNQVGVPVQVVMEPDFLSYMHTATPPDPAYVPDPKDRTLNTAKVSQIYEAGLLNKSSDPQFDDNLAGMVKGINYYVGKTMPNLRIGWATNIWGVNLAYYQNQLMGLMHETDSVLYPWQSQWSGGTGWEQGRASITAGVTDLGSFLNKVGVTSWQTGSSERKPFLTVDKYGVDAAYLYDPQWNEKASGTAAAGNAKAIINGAQYFCANSAKTCDDKAAQKYFGLAIADLIKVPLDNDGDTNFQTAVTTLQNAAKDDPNIAQWFFNADQWNNYLLMVKTLSTGLNAPVMLWQIPQGHINGSTKITGRELSNTSNNLGCPSGTACGFEDSATSYFFGDSFTATGGRLSHFGANQAGDSSVTVSGSTVSWGEHMTQAGQSGVMSVLFGAGLGPSTRGAPTPGGDVTDLYFWSDKVAGYLTGKA